MPSVLQDYVAIVIRDDGRLLFVKRSATKKNLPNIWAFPSGTLKEGESPEEAAVREAKEELGVGVAVESAKAGIELPEFGVRLIFALCSVESGAPTVQAPDEIQALRWMALPDFFREFTDADIGHGLRYLRQHPEALDR